MILRAGRYRRRDIRPGVLTFASVGPRDGHCYPRRLDTVYAWARRLFPIALSLPQFRPHSLEHWRLTLWCRHGVLRDLWPWHARPGWGGDLCALFTFLVLAITAYAASLPMSYLRMTMSVPRTFADNAEQ